MALVLLLSLLATPGAEAPPGIIWATITRAPAGYRERLVLDFGTLGVVPGQPGRLVYFVRRTTTTRYPEVRQVTWADSITCPGVINILSDLRALPTPRIDVPGFPSQPGGVEERIAIGGVEYRLNFSDLLSYSMNVDSALSRWTDGAIRRLEPCWRAEVPRSAF